MQGIRSAPWSLIGIGVVLLIVVGTIVLVSFKLALDSGLPGSPLDLPRAGQSLPPDLLLRRDRASRGEQIELSVAQLSTIAGSTLRDWADRGAVGPRSCIGLEPTGPDDSRLRLRVSFELPASAGNWISGRFVNLDATLQLQRQLGRDRVFEIERYQYGNLDAVGVEDPAELIERMRVNGRLPDEAWAVWDRLYHFTQVGDQVTVQLRPGPS